MKAQTLFLLAPLALALSLQTSRADDEDSEPQAKPLDELVFGGKIWEQTLEDVKKAHDPPPADDENDEDDDEAKERSAELKADLKKKGIFLLDDEEPGAFQWLSSAKQGIRAGGGHFTLLDEPVGETVLRTKGSVVSDATIMIYNRGDDGVLLLPTYEKKLAEWRTAISEKLEVRPEDRSSRKGLIQVDGWMWRKGDTAWLLEGSVTRKENRVEYIRLRMAPLNAARGESRTVSRSSLDENVLKEKGGDVLIPSIPMVDQGDKGYCVVATVERVARYYGADVDQHQLAQLANTTADRGTSGDSIEKAFKTLTGKIHVRTIRLIDYSDRQFERDYRDYNRAAKKVGAKVFEEDLDEWYIDPRWFWSGANKEVFRDMKGKQNKCEHFERKIKEYIDQGIPLCWVLYLGMFPEDEDMPQMWGGHMRLIIGYNTEKKEIIYSDSWGEGHARKRMRLDEAWSMTMALYTMLPSR